MELKFRKSSYSGEGGNCVEVASLPGVALVRDSKDPEGPVLAIPAEEFAAFVRCLRGATR
ncbi:DUF397 domain-containing protein [Sphaerisporangium fuscum]|uniref:DUF397 domain-containing protein n=1 Tax=Sphaerisporangium fuscum TaxID=2835868 RepID=UPI001BDC851D|nr:DUF397 domain-containing protein [Sphaerisporangium fuscum]